jgi:hypothetical protein
VSRIPPAWLCCWCPPFEGVGAGRRCFDEEDEPLAFDLAELTFSATNVRPSALTRIIHPAREAWDPGQPRLRNESLQKTRRQETFDQASGAKMWRSPVYECTAHRLGVGARAPESSPHARLYCAAGDALAVAAHEQRRVRRPTGKPVCCQCFGGRWEAVGPAVEVVLDDPQQVGLDRNGAVLAAFSADKNDSTATGGRTDITNIRFAQFVCARPGEQTGQNQRQVSFGPVGAARGLPVAVNRLEQRADCRW